MLIAKLDWSTNIMLLLHEKEKRQIIEFHVSEINLCCNCGGKVLHDSVFRNEIYYDASMFNADTKS